jgi:hypothetical protein
VSQALEQVVVSEVVGVGAVGESDDVDAGAELGANARSGSSTGVVAIEQEHDTGLVIQEPALRLGQCNAEQGDRRDLQLVEAHGAPGVLDDNERLGVAARDSMVVVEELALGQRWKDPLAAEPDLVRVEAAPSVADGAAVGIVESDADAAVEHSAAVVLAGLEAASGAGPDALGLEERRVRFEA